MNSIEKVYALARQAGNYNEEGKKKFMRAGRSFFQRLVKDLKLVGGQYEIRDNKGGPAVSGEVTLHHETFYVQFSDSGCMYRSCKSQKDYSGGINRWFVYSGMSAVSYTEMRAALTRELVARNF